MVKVLIKSAGIVVETKTVENVEIRTKTKKKKTLNYGRVDYSESMLVKTFSDKDFRKGS